MSELSDGIDQHGRRIPFDYSSEAQPQESPSDMEPYDKCAGSDCSQCDGVNCTCVHHAPHKHNCPNCFHFFYCVEVECATDYSASCPECNRKLGGEAQAQPPQGVAETINFSCRVCGVQCAVAPDPPERAVCPEHCEDHNYVYSREDRGTFCEYCWQEAPHDYYLED